MKLPEPLELPLFAARDVLSVSRLNREARMLIEGGLGSVWVEGEVSNLSRPGSGHLYWTLKDADAQVRCAMFRQRNRQARDLLSNGRHVVVRARASVYEARGDFQLVVEDVEEAGEGLLRRRFEVLKAKLEAEGLFDEGRKRPLPRFPACIGVVTSRTGAALRDVLTVLRRRYPCGHVVIYPTPVQGAAAAAEIARTLALADQRDECDVLILARGGGSLEDLWAFNEEIVARAIRATTRPVVVGVGHQTDFTIADFAADLRAPTPSQAAELAAPDQREWCARAEQIETRLARAVNYRLTERARVLAVISHRLSRCDPGRRLREAGQRLDELQSRLTRVLPARLRADQARLQHLEAALAIHNPRPRLHALQLRLELAQEGLRRALREREHAVARRLAVAMRALQSLSPLSTLARGYAIVADSSGSVVRSYTQAVPGMSLGIRLAEGHVEAKVTEASAVPPHDTPAVADKDAVRLPEYSQAKKEDSTGRK